MSTMGSLYQYVCTFAKTQLGRLDTHVGTVN